METKNNCALDKLARQARDMDLTQIRAEGKTYIFTLKLKTKEAVSK